MNEQQSQNGTSGKIKGKYWKFVIGFLGIIILVLVGYPFAENAYYRYLGNKAIRDYQEFEKQLLDSLENDTYGGKTPQETYEMFVNSLRDGDILSAAKYYYYDEDKITAYKKFKKIQDDGMLKKWVSELPEWSEMKWADTDPDYWDKDSKKFVYKKFREKEEIYDNPYIKGIKTVLPVGEYEDFILFKISEIIGIWKISIF